MTVTDRLLALADREYADFQAKLAPTVKRETCIGVRVPVLRKFAADFAKEPACSDFLTDLPHRYYDENMLHSVLLSKEKDFDTALSEVEAFLPYVDNWAVCDTLSPKAFAKHPERLLPRIRAWASSGEVYTCRFGMDMLMTHFLDERFQPEYLEIPASVQSEEYYVNMMLAWFYATALAKQWDATLPYLSQNRLSVWVHNKTIRKAIESYRITDSRKMLLRALARKEKDETN